MLSSTTRYETPLLSGHARDVPGWSRLRKLLSHTRCRHLASIHCVVYGLNFRPKCLRMSVFFKKKKTLPNIETRNKQVCRDMYALRAIKVFAKIMSTLISFDVSALLAANGAPPSTRGLCAVAVIVLHVVCSLFVASLSSLLFAAFSGP